jgi:hypothetical protein
MPDCVAANELGKAFHQDRACDRPGARIGLKNAPGLRFDALVVVLRV